MRPHTRLIDGTLYVRTAQPGAFDVRIHDLGHGHVEATALPHYTWEEASPDASHDASMAASHAWESGGWVPCVHPPREYTEQELLDRAAANRDKAARRARTTVRRLVKFKGLDTMLTLTYRENMTDRDRLKRDVDAFLKRVRRALPGFEYICVFERQKRGAWHAHLAVRRIAAVYVHRGVLVKSYNLLRAMWRGVVGADNGNIDVSRSRRVGRSAARLALYLSKYIGKTFSEVDQRHANSYSASGRALPSPAVLRVFTGDQCEAARRLLEMVSRHLREGCEFHQAFLDGGGYFLCVGPPDRVTNSGNADPA